MRIIGVSGKARSGKDTVGDYLVQQHKFVRLAFASPMKHMISTLLNAPVEWIEHADNKELPVPGLNHSPRELLQTLGTEWGRDTLYEEFWVDIAWRQVFALIESDHCAGIVITDVRFENEAERIREFGGIIWHMHREVPDVAGHASERGVLTQATDCIIDNNATLEDLHIRVDRTLDLYDTLISLRR